MKRLLLLGTIAALALTTTGQAQSLEERQVSQPVVKRHSTQVSQPVVKRHSTQATTVAPSRTRNVVTYRNGARYYSGGGRYYSTGGYPYYYNGGPSVAVGVGGYYPYNYGYGYGYPVSYGYNSYPSDYYYANEYPAGYTTTTTRYVTSGYGDLAYNDNIVVAVQERLARAGSYVGAIDGVAGPETRSAVARWEGNHGMYADGRIDSRSLSSMGISVNG